MVEGARWSALGHNTGGLVGSIVSGSGGRAGKGVKGAKEEGGLNIKKDHKRRLRRSAQTWAFG